MSNIYFPDPDLEVGEVVIPMRGTQRNVVGIINHIPQFQKIYAVVQFGSAGPFRKLKVTNLRRATREEAARLLGVGGAKIRDKHGALVGFDYE